MSGHLPPVARRDAPRATFAVLAADDFADLPRFFARFTRRDRAAMRASRNRLRRPVRKGAAQ